MTTFPAIVMFVVFSSLIGPSMAIADSKIPEKDRIAGGSLALVAAAWALETACGLPSTEDHSLIMRYLKKIRDRRIADSVLTMYGATTSVISKDPSACNSLKSSVEKGAETGRAVLEYLLSHPAAANEELDRLWPKD